jgi:hypothetical protein
VPDYFDWVVLLNMRVVASGPTAEVFTRENLRQNLRRPPQPAGCGRDGDPRDLNTAMPFTLHELREVLLLQSHNTRLVVFATMLLGVAGGLAGGFLLLRKRALFGDVLSHATLPGIALAFAAGTLLWGSGKQLGLLLAAQRFPASPEWPR